jgi:acyl-CoA dehydrogenase
MRREVYAEEHELYRDQFRRFAEREITPALERWSEQGYADREIWRKLGAAGFLAADVPEDSGGAGGDFRYHAVLVEEMARLRAHGPAIGLHSGIVLPYLTSFGTPEQKRKYAAPAAAGELVLGICMTEPGTGSDLAAIRTTARRDGDTYVLNGAKTFISNGFGGELFVVVAKTDPEAKPAHKGISLILVEADSPGFVRGRRLEKLGLKSQDCCELYFEDCRVPAANLLGGEGRGFAMLMQKLQQERLVISLGNIAACRAALDDTIAYVKQRRAFGRAIADFQNTQFVLAELATEVEIGQTFVDRLLAAHVRGEDVVAEVSMAKWWVAELQKRLTSRCLQLHGGYGFMKEYRIAGDYADAAVQTIHGGTSEIMKVILAKRLGLGGGG